jgi:Ran GTPase-activating protein (RanGAP) involved in mRNA processing and transport
MQKLKTLSLINNQIGDEGTACLADALQENNVIYTHHLFFHTYLLLSIQKLLILTLDDNQISAAGAHHLACALKRNQVIWIDFRSFSYRIFPFHLETQHTEPHQ